MSRALGCASPQDGDDAASGASSSETASSAVAPVEGSAAPEAMAVGSAGSSVEAREPGAIGNIVPGSDPVAGPLEAPAGSAGCGQSSALGSGDQSLQVAGVTRTYVLDLPPAYDGSRAFPLVFAFHGASTSGRLFRSAFYGNLLSAMGDEAILVHPDALGEPTAWNTAADVPFFDALVRELTSRLCVNEERIFATGHSSGGFFTNTLGCSRGDVLRAIAPVSGGGPLGRSCTGQVAAWVAHAENDATVNFTNGEGSRDRWLSANGCGDSTRAVSPNPCVEYAGCDAGSPVRWCVYQDGHNWPEFAPAGIWEFFSAL
jgi:polyhydroxybutyrate depolymerase